MSELISTKEAVQGLACPRCGGMVPIPEGQALVCCPYCEQRSVVSAEQSSPGDLSGVRRYQAPLKIPREQAEQALRGFLTGKVQIARDAAAQAQLSEAFLVHLPFWAVWGRGVAWAFGQKKVGSGDKQRYEPVEKSYSSDLDWNCPACEVGEFGVRQVSLDGCPLQPFNPDELHRSGMVFEPVGSAQQALQNAEAEFSEKLKNEVSISRTTQLFAKVVRPRLGLVYYPLWVLRYLYRGRAFQVVVDGYSGQVLYGKAPGSVAYRAAMLVGGMALGAFLAIDVPALILSSSSSSSDDNPFLIVLVIFVIGLAVIWNSFRTFRYAEHYEYHRFGRSKVGGTFGRLTGELPRGLDSVFKTLEKME